MAYKPKIFIVGEGQDSLIALEETGYVTESVLQDLLTDYPDLLPGEQMNPDDPRRWLHVAAEMGVPGGTDEADRWSLDHLFLDQDGVPTFVECKRAVDTRTRREVVAQMLDYAANGIEYWSMERIRQAAAETAAARDSNLDEDISELLGDESEADVESYWQQVEANLKAHRVRLLFVADTIPRELRRLVEFLNAEMAKVEVLAVEVKRFQQQDGKGQKALVPRVVNPPRDREPLPPRPKSMSQDEFLEKCTPAARRFFERVLRLATERGHAITWGVQFGLRAHSPKTGGLSSFAYGVPPDKFQFYFHKDWVMSAEMLSATRKALLGFGVFSESGKWSLNARVTQENRARLDEVYDRILNEVDAHLKAQRQPD